MRLPPEFPDDDDDCGRGLVIGIIGGVAFWLALIALVYFATSCASTDIYQNGQLVAHVQGNLEYHKTADGSESLTVNHSAVIQSYGTATAKAAGAIGAAATAFKIIP